MTQSNGVMQPMAKSSQQMCFLWPEQCFFFLKKCWISCQHFKIEIPQKILDFQLLLKKFKDANSGSTSPHTNKSQLELCHSCSVQKGQQLTSVPGAPLSPPHPLCVLWAPPWEFASDSWFKVGEWVRPVVCWWVFSNRLSRKKIVLKSPDCSICHGQFQATVLSLNVELGRDAHYGHSQASKTNPRRLQAHTDLSSKSGLPGNVSYLSRHQGLPMLTGRNKYLPLRTTVSFK